MNDYQVSMEESSSEFGESYDDKKVVRGALYDEPLSRVPRRTMLTLPVSSTISDAVRAMNLRGVGVALILRDGKLAGIFTERDVLRKIAATSMNTDTTAVEKVMTADPDTLPEDASIAYALRKMSIEGYRHIPLVRPDGSPVGVVAVRDIVAWMVELFPAHVFNLPPAPVNPATTEGG